MVRITISLEISWKKETATDEIKLFLELLQFRTENQYWACRHTAKEMAECVTGLKKPILTLNKIPSIAIIP